MSSTSMWLCTIDVQRVFLPLCFHSSQSYNAPWRLEKVGYEYRSQASCENYRRHVRRGWRLGKMLQGLQPVDKSFIQCFTFTNMVFPLGLHESNVLTFFCLPLYWLGMFSLKNSRTVRWITNQSLHWHRPLSHFFLKSIQSDPITAVKACVPTWL